MNIYIYESKTYVRSILIWSLSIIGLLIIFMSFYPTFGSNVAFMDKMLENYPEELLHAFGMASGLSLATVPGFLVFVYTFIQLCLAIQACNYGFSFLSVEERELTADFLMSKPVSRNKILLTKFLAAYTALLVTNAATWGGTILSLELFNDGKPYEIKDIILLLLSNFYFQLVFMTFSMLVSVSLKKVRSVLSFSVAVAFGTYMLNAVASILDSDTLGIISPFYHFEPGYILGNGAYHWSVALISIAVILLSIVGTYILYNKRNIHSL